VLFRKKQRNEVFDLVQQVGLSPADFSWDRVDERSRITHVPTGDGYVFGRTRSERGGLMATYFNTISELIEGSWRAQRRAFRSWLHDLREEMPPPTPGHPCSLKGNPHSLTQRRTKRTTPRSVPKSASNSSCTFSSSEPRWQTGRA
jgi:hypothetical protein